MGRRYVRSQATKVFGQAPRQLCAFHVIAELVQGVCKAVASERKHLEVSKPKLKRVRPSSKDKAAPCLAPSTGQQK